MSLIDCYSSYHQIWMKKEDGPKTSFITPSGTYCYLRMPEGLKNAGGSFSRMTAKVLHSQIDRNVLTYVDDIIVKSTKQGDGIRIGLLHSQNSLCLAFGLQDALLFWLCSRPMRMPSAC